MGSTLKVYIDREGCIGCAACEAVCPEVFRVIEDGKSAIVEKYRRENLGKGEVGEELRRCVKDAEASCPVEVISTE